MKKVLLISSHVARGSVGAVAAQFVLQRLGIEVWTLPSVVLSNHHGHDHFAGARIKPVQLRPMLEALEFNDWLEQLDGVMTGFLPTADHAEFAAEAVDLVRAANPSAVYLCDPAVGDDPKGLYVERAAAETLRMELLPRADIITPNRFELEWFAARPVRNIVEAANAAATLSTKPEADAPQVLATSIPEGRSQLCNLLVHPDGQWRTLVDKREDIPNGTGDIFAAFYFAHALAGTPGANGLALATAALELLVDAWQPSQDELPLLETQSEWVSCKPVSVELIKEHA